jgi:hypothetical protein
VSARGGAVGRGRVARLAPVLCALACACASGSSGSGGSGTAPRTGSRSPITTDEIGERRALDLYTIVQQLRPNWMQMRGQATPVGGVRTVQVVIDGTLQPGGLEVLRSLRGTQVEEVRFLNGQDATTRYGLDVEAGVIVVTTLRGGEGP